MDDTILRRFALEQDERQGGQDLIANEIAACMADVEQVWLPIDPRLSLIAAVGHIDKEVCLLDEEPTRQYGVYMGTPTIVNDKPLFPTAQFNEAWTKERERSFVKSLCQDLEQDELCKVIVTGLGSGDISVEERLYDMGGGRVACIKYFDHFTDWVLVRRLP